MLASTHRNLDVLVVAPPDDPRAAEAVRACAQVRSGRVRVVDVPAGPPWLDAAVAEARGTYLAFVDADDEVPPEAYATLVRELERTGSDLAVGSGGEHRRAQNLRSRPDVLARTALTDAVFRTAFWRSAGLSLPDWHRGAVTVVTAYLAARSFDELPDEVYRRRPRDLSLPVDEQERFKAERAAQLARTLLDIDALLVAHDADLDRRWRTLALTHTLPAAYTDAIGGGEEFLGAVRPVVRHLVGGAGGDEVLAQVPVAARLGAWVAAHGSLDDLALMLDHLADHPHGLPVDHADDVVEVHLPGMLGGLVPDSVRRIEEVDRRLRTRLTGARIDDAGTLVLEGAAFLEHVEGTHDLGVRLVGPDGATTPLVPEVRPDPGINLWARRAFEDRTTAGFRAVAAPEHLPGGPHGPWQVVLTLGGRSHTHPAPRPAAPAGTDPTLVGAELADHNLRLHGTGPGRARPATVMLRGGRGASPRVPVEGEGATWSAVVPLLTDLFGDSVQLPAGRYALEVLDASGVALSPQWAPAILDSPPVLVGRRLRVEPHRGPRGAVVSVAAPLDPQERSVFDQQRLLTTVYAAPAAAPTDPPTVLLETFRGRSVGDNPGAIGGELLARGLDLDLAWVVDDPSVQVPDGTRPVQRRSEEWYAALARARVYVANAGAPYWFEKKPGQLHLQTWHGTPLKRIGEDRGPGDFSTWRHRRRIAAQAAGWDAMISPSPFCSGIFPSAFRYGGELLEVGYPRNDVLSAGDAVRERVRAALRLGPEDQAVLYAPTWREYVGVRDAKPLYLDAERFTDRHPASVVLVRGHYNSTTQADVFSGHPRILDVTRYPDIADLYLAADVLVTDYSSVMFDFALTDKRIVLLTPDLEQYRDVERGFYLDLESRAPGRIVSATDEVLEELAGPDEHGPARAAFRADFCPWDDGGASRRTVDWLLARL